MTASHRIQKFDATTHDKLPVHILPEDKDSLGFFGTTVSKTGTWVRAVKAGPNPNWSPAQTLSGQPTSAPDDIGLIILSEDIPASARIAEIGERAAALPANILLPGFGVTTSRDTNDTGILRQVETPVDGADASIKRISVGTFGRGACAGDSGGPAYIQKNGKLVVVGATSTGAELGGYCLGLMNDDTDARYYKQWIQGALAANGAGWSVGGNLKLVSVSKRRAPIPGARRMFFTAVDRWNSLSVFFVAELRVTHIDPFQTVNFHLFSSGRN